MYDTLLPLFSGTQPNVAQNEVNIQPMQVSNDNIDQPIFDADLHDALVDEREDIESHGLYKNGWCRLCVRGNWTRLCLVVLSGSHSASYVSHCYALAVSSLCDEFERVTFDEAQNPENWMASICNQNMMLL